MALFTIAAGLSGGVANAHSPVFDHQRWDRVLHEHVSREGLVDYASLKRDPEELLAYVDAIAANSPDSSPEMFPTEAHRLAYWINAYNALIVARVVPSYPVKSINDLGGFLSSVFSKKQTVGGKQLSYDDIEHGIIRKRFHDPRIHFVLNCASRSCAPLRAEALTADNLDRVLDDAAKRFLNARKNFVVHPEKGRVELSKYFDWFADDFESYMEKETGGARSGVLGYVERYLDPANREKLAQRKRWKVHFLHYDWSLNDASGTAGTRPTALGIAIRDTRPSG